MPDYRTKPSSELTFYTFSQPNGLFGISRYDTLDEAINKFKEDLKTPSSFSGIGVSRNGTSEVDILQKNQDTIAIVTDYKKINATKFDAEIENAAKKIAADLGIVWEYSHDIFKGSRFSSLCVPCIFDKSQLLHNERVEDLTLNPIVINHISTAIDKLYISDKGWMDTYDVMNMCRSGEGLYPKIETVSVNVKTDHAKEQASIEISPNDYFLMADNYVLANQNLFPAYEVCPVIESLAGDLHDFMRDFDTYEYKDNLPAGGEREAVAQIFSDIQNGNTQPYIAELKSIIEDAEIPGDSLMIANELVSRLKKATKDEIKQELAGKIEQAEKNNITSLKNGPMKEDIDIEPQK